MDNLNKLVDDRNRKYMAFIIKARDLSLANLYLITTFGRTVEQLESSDFEVN